MSAFHRSIAKRVLRSLGLERIHHPSFVDLMLRENIDTVIDVGANEGQFATDIRERGYRGRILSLEPIAAAHASLERHAKGDRHWQAYRLALGAESGRRSISVAAESEFSSFLPTSAYTAGKFVGARTEREEMVDVVRLDEFLSIRNIDLERTYLKIDTQGFEKQVLLGAGDRLRAIRAIQLELPLRTLYDGQASFIEMVSWMEDRGFQIAMAKENGFDWQTTRLLELDLVFVRGTE